MTCTLLFIIYMIFTFIVIQAFYVLDFLNAVLSNKLCTHYIILYFLLLSSKPPNQYFLSVLWFSILLFYPIFYLFRLFQAACTHQLYTLITIPIQII